MGKSQGRKEKRLRPGEDTQSHANDSQKRRKTIPLAPQGHVHHPLANGMHEALLSSDGPRSSFLPSSSAPSYHTALCSSPQHAPSSNCASARIPPIPPAHRPNAPIWQLGLPDLPPIGNQVLLQAVFTHPGFLKGHNSTKIDTSYDRLEFLGDAYIEVMATRLIYPLYSHMPAGRLSQQRELLVKNETLAGYSLAYGFDQRARLAPAEIKESIEQAPRQADFTQTGRKARMKTTKENTRISRKVLGDIFEAYVAGIILSDAENGFQIAEGWLRKLWTPELEGQAAIETRKMDTDAKVKLSKRVMGKGIKLLYCDEAPPDLSEKKAGKIWYHIGAFLTGWGYENVRLGGGRGLSKQAAGTEAAEEALTNELTEKIEEIKRKFDLKVAEEREAKARAEEQKPEKDDTAEGAKQRILERKVMLEHAERQKEKREVKTGAQEQRPGEHDAEEDPVLEEKTKLEYETSEGEDEGEISENSDSVRGESDSDDGHRP